MSLGLRYIALSALFFSVMSLLVKWAGQTLPTGEIVFARLLIALVLSYTWIKHAKIPPWGQNKKLLILRALLGFGGVNCFFYALTHLPLADAIVIQYTNPIFTSILAAIFLRESINRWDLLGGLGCIVGLLLLTQPSFLFAGQSRLDPVGVAAALGGALFSASAYTTVRKLGETEHPMVIVFYFPLIATPLAGGVMWPVLRWPEGLEWLVLAGVGIFTQVAQIYLTKGLALEKAGRAMTVSYLQIVFGFVWGILFFGEFPSALALVGAVVMVGSVLLVSRQSRRRKSIHPK